MADTKTKRTWISIVVAILVLLFVMAAGVVATGVFYVRRHVHAEFVTTAVGSETFERERARFAGQEPLIEMREHGETVIHHRTATSTVQLQAMHILAFDPRAGRVVRVSIPFWLLRMAPGKHLNLGGNGQGFDFDTERMHVTVDDLERAGPGLLLDGISPRDSARVLIWAE
jgi:hypothetical protein